MPQENETLEEVAHFALGVGRLMFANGVEASHVGSAVTRVVQAYGYEPRLVINYEALMLTLTSGEQFRTKVGYRVPAIGVNMAVVEALNRLVAEVENQLIHLKEAQSKLEAIPHARPIWNRWVVVLGLGMTAGCLAQLFGGDWGAFWVAWLAGSFGMFLRQEMGRLGFNIFLIPFLAATASGIVGAIGVMLHLSSTPALCLLAPGMVIVPGVPLINAVEEMIKNYITLGLARLTLGLILTLAIALGLYTASVVTGVELPVSQVTQLLPVWEDAIFSALAAVGFLFLFNVPFRLAWACVICGIASHALRTACLGFGLNIVTGTFLGAVAVGFLSQAFARRYQAPAVMFAFPGVVAMVPGAYAFRAFAGSMSLVKGGAETDLAIVSETLALGVSCAMMVGAIAVGLAVPLILNRSNER